MLLYVWTVTSSFSAALISASHKPLVLPDVPPSPLTTACVPVMPQLPTSQEVPLLLIHSSFSAGPDTSAHLLPGTTSKWGTLA